ncbi:MAG: hypothetical protein OEY51_09360, partial [Cyclobacteriaceae bacterium]|nr:hypothetical protein [Cyclobacteriaceae bacterium]
MKKHVLYMILFITSVATGHSQPEDGIRVLARSWRGDSIVLRWGPLSPASWQLCNQYGYGIERYTLRRNEVFLEPFETTGLTPTPLKP